MQIRTRIPRADGLEEEVVDVEEVLVLAKGDAILRQPERPSNGPLD